MLNVGQFPHSHQACPCYSNFHGFLATCNYFNLKKIYLFASFVRETRVDAFVARSRKYWFTTKKDYFYKTIRTKVLSGLHLIKSLCLQTIQVSMLLSTQLPGITLISHKHLDELLSNAIKIANPHVPMANRTYYWQRGH